MRYTVRIVYRLYR